MPSARRNEVSGWIDEEVRDFSISRSAVDWGIRVPKDPSHTVYVWFDALIGYLSALLPEGTPPTLDNLKAAGWPADVHVIGKDILRFHAVYWPGMLAAMGLPPPRQVFGHGFLTKDGLKMGKSLGNVLNPFELTEGYGADAVRCVPPLLLAMLRRFDVQLYRSILIADRWVLSRLCLLGAPTVAVIALC